MLSLHDCSICCQVLCQIGDGIAADLDAGCGPGRTGGCGGVDAGGVVDKIGVEAGGFDLILRQVPGQLVDDGADHLQVPQFLCTYRGVILYQTLRKACGAVSMAGFHQKLCIFICRL